MPVVVAIGFSVLWSCTPINDLEDLDGVQYDARYAIPILNSEVTIEDFLVELDDNAEILIDQDGVLRFKYRGDVISATVEQMFESINEALPPLIPISASGEALPLSSPDGLQIDFLNLKKGSFSYVIQSDFSEPVDVTLTMPQFTKDEVPLQLKASLAAYGGTGDLPVATNLLIPSSLEGYTILPENDSVYIEYLIESPSGVITEPLSGLVIRLNDLEFAYAEGFLGKLVYEGGRDTIEIDFFDSWVQGEVYFEDPSFTFIINNSFGIPTRSQINIFEVFTVRQEKLPLESPDIDNGIDFPFPELNEVGQTKSKTFLFDKENSNIREILGAGPLAVDYDVDAVTNPDEDFTIRGFVTDSSEYNVQVEVDLPLYGSIKEYAAFDTIAVDFEDFEEANAAEFKFVAENGIPLEVKVQGYFVDANQQVLDSLFKETELIIDGAPVDANGIPTGINRVETFITFEGNRFGQILDAEEIQLQVLFSTTNTGNESVQIINTQNIRIKVGAILGLSE